MLGALTNADVISNISTVSRTYSPFSHGEYAQTGHGSGGTSETQPKAVLKLAKAPKTSQCAPEKDAAKKRRGISDDKGWWRGVGGRIEGGWVE